MMRAPARGEHEYILDLNRFETQFMAVLQKVSPKKSLVQYIRL